MKRHGILNGDLAGHLARLGHTDTFLVVDSGFPVPAGVPVVDLRVVFGVPPFEPVFSAVLDDVVVEHGVAASELPDANPVLHRAMIERLPGLELTPHIELKRRAVGARFAVRTAEDTPYGNILLTAGVAFDV